MSQPFFPGERVIMAVDYAKTVIRGEMGTVLPSQGPGGYVDVRWDNGQVRGHAADMLACDSHRVTSER